jgi:predicted transcriptional regulator YdeE
MQLELEDFEIVGIPVRTTNQNGQAEKDIRALWENFYKDESFAKIEGKISEDLYCVYTDYEKDHSGAYTAILGYLIKPDILPPSGCVRKIILRSRYEVFISQGPLPESVQQTWMNIWKSNLKRRYTADFDVYGPHSKSPEYAIVRTFVSIQR